MRDIATANPDLKVVYSESDVMQAGIEQGLKQAGIWKDILEATYDGEFAQRFDPELLQGVVVGFHCLLGRDLVIRLASLFGCGCSLPCSAGRSHCIQMQYC
jgi:hypothetical protein